MVISLVQLFIKLFVFKTDREYSYEVHTPNNHSPKILQEIKVFRNKLYADKTPYLLSPLQSEIESKFNLDERSFQVIARRKSNGEIIGSLRLTPYPFELAALNDEINWSRPDFTNKLEIGRLLTDPSVRNVGKKIMILAGIHSSENTNFEGFIGVSRTERIEYFKNFGMKVISNEINLKGRPMKYFVINSDFNTMRSNVVKNFVSRLVEVPLLSREKAKV